MSVPRFPLLLLLLAGVLYSGTLTAGFHFDDFHSIVRNPHLESPSLKSLGDPVSFSDNPKNAMFRPVVLVSYLMNRAVSGAAPWSYHAFNVALHGAAVVLLYRLAIHLGVGLAAAGLAALVYAVHPINSEATSYVSSRSELLMAVSSLAACLLFVRYRSGGGGSLLAGAVLCAGLALLSKSVAIILPGLMVLCASMVRDRVHRRGWKSYSGFVSLSLVYLYIVGVFAERAVLSEPVRPLTTQLWTQAKAFVYYVQLLIMPVHLSVEHQFSVSRHPTELVVVLALLTGVSVLLLATRIRGWLAFSAGWGLIAMIPASAVPLIVLVNEHRVYLAMAGLAIGLAVLLTRGHRLPAVAAVGVGLYTIVLAGLTGKRVGDWSSEEKLWTSAAQLAPQMLRPHLRVADALAARGEWEEAEESYLHALGLRPHHPATRNNLGRMYLVNGRWDAAAEQFRSLLQVFPDNVAARLNLASMLLRSSRWREAREHYERALTYDPRAGRAHQRLGQIALQYEGDPARALRLFETAGEQEETPSLLLAQGVALRQLGQTEQAAETYRRVLQLDEESWEAWHNLSNLFLEQGKREQALEALRRVRDGAAANISEHARRRLRELSTNSGGG